MSADSLSAKVGVNQINGVIECKIHQEGDIFFTIVGINNDPTVKVDLVAIAIQASRTKGGIGKIVSSFDRLAASSLRRLPEGRAFHSALPADKITAIFVSKREHALAIKEYTFGSDGSVHGSLPDIRGTGHGQSHVTDYTAVGVFAEAQAAVDRDPVLSRSEGVPFILGFMKAQITYEQVRLREHTIPRVGGPVCILSIEAGRAAWIPGYQQPCPNIKP